ncbi:uncharacterized protein HGUI_02502 [Hanseniaspora guilliermondii]|uniref:N-acetylglucosaminylphosphatidylinositol deacetylase n=1 Tax=Hanseniaspora guilliermondii TaxID=56406 RepID=A0A1L0FL61_9ASCO|nr:uncharacterized protein HGUI_02502 [Hanseniaspora guilliermondii]
MDQYIKKNDINYISFIIGHPDDEIMFFNQVLLSLNNLNKQELLQIHVICLTNKDTIRHHELIKSCEQLLSNHLNILKVSAYDYKDSMTESWNEDDVSLTLKNIMNHVIPSRSLIITFDKYGISNHINHRTCYQLCKDNFKDSHVFALKTPSFALKYSSFFILLFTYFSSILYPSNEFNEIKFNNYSIRQWLHVVSVMCNCHKSQMVWYRWLWWIFNSLVWSCKLININETNIKHIKLKQK